VENISFKNDITKRYTNYIIEGKGKNNLTIQEKTRDPNLAAKFYKPLVIEQTGFKSNIDLIERGNTENRTRTAGSLTASATVRGFEIQKQFLKPGDYLEIDAPEIYLNKSFFISAADYSQSATAGSVLNLELEQPDALEF